ncbi:TPA: hypothetical protein ACXXN2_002658, partial [Enterococcus faecium]
MRFLFFVEFGDLFNDFAMGGGDGIPILNAGVKAFRSLVVPILGGSWWFVTSYVFVLFISPVVNSLIKELHFKACLQVVIVCYLLVYVCSYILE